MKFIQGLVRFLLQVFSTKHFEKPIEQILLQGGAIFTYLNPDKAKAYGAEVEFRKRLDVVSALKNFTVQANDLISTARLVV